MVGYCRNNLRKSDSSGVDPDNATHYYYTFGALAQEYDEHLVSEIPADDFEFDYLRGFDGHVLRRRDVEGADPDRQPLKDLLASPLNLVNADDGVMSASTSGYTFDAWGESFAAGDAQGQPAEANHIRYHGAFAEEFVSPDDTDGVYRMGARHYSTVLGRYFQREPMTLVGLPSPANPLGVNAYLYSHNSPTTTSDISGLQTMNVSSGGNLYPPEKPEVMPYEPLPDPDPGMEGPDEFPGKPGMMAFQIPGGLSPWWDRRFPAMPLPDICMGINLPEPWMTPEQPPSGTPSIWDSLGGFMGSAGRALAGAGGGRPYGPGRQFINVSGGGSSGGRGGHGGGRRTGSRNKNGFHWERGTLNGQEGWVAVCPPGGVLCYGDEEGYHQEHVEPGSAMQITLNVSSETVEYVPPAMNTSGFWDAQVTAAKTQVWSEVFKFAKNVIFWCSLGLAAVTIFSGILAVHRASIFWARVYQGTLFSRWQWFTNNIFRMEANLWTFNIKTQLGPISLEWDLPHYHLPVSKIIPQLWKHHLPWEYGAWTKNMISWFKWLSGF